MAAGATTKEAITEIPAGARAAEAIERAAIAARPPF